MLQLYSMSFFFYFICPTKEKSYTHNIIRFFFYCYLHSKYCKGVWFMFLNSPVFLFLERHLSLHSIPAGGGKTQFRSFPTTCKNNKKEEGHNRFLRLSVDCAVGTVTEVCETLYILKLGMFRQWLHWVPLCGGVSEYRVR